MGAVAVWKDEKVLEMDDGKASVIKQMCLMPLNCMHEIVKMVNVILCVFYYSNKFF
jgi:hypothetical protein